MLRTVLGLFIISVLTEAAVAAPSRLSGKLLKDLVAGAVIELNTPIGTKMPMRFGENGIVSGRAGILAGFLGAAKDRGRWWVERDRLCIKWFRWFDAEPRCMTISVEGTRIFWTRDDGDRGTATLTEHAKPKVAERTGLAAGKPKKIAAAKTDTTPKEVPAPKTAAVPESVAIAQKFAALAKAETPEEAASGAGPSGAASVTPTPAVDASQEAPAVVVAADAALSLLPAQFAKTPSSDADSQIKTASLAGTAPAPVPAKRPKMALAETASDPGKAPSAKPKSQKKKVAGVSKAESQSSAPKNKGSAKPSKSQSTFRVVRVDADDLLNIRSGPSELHDPVGIIPSRGRGVKMTGACVGKWCPIRHHGVQGWVHRYYLAKE